jgi:hypothetical protein
MIRFRREDDFNSSVAPEVIMVNAHDGTSAYKLMAGVFRFACLNGLVCVEEDHGSIKIAHKGDVIGKVIDGSYTVINDGRERVKIAAEWSHVGLNRDEQRIFAEAAHSLRFDEGSSLATAIRPERLLTVRRVEDREPTLWNTYNVIQENAIRGGLQGVVSGVDEETGRPTRRRTSTRAVTGIDQDVKLNAALHRLASEMAKLKGAAA